jgi:probable rRNA maturation factor
MAVGVELDLAYAARRPWAPRRGQFARWAEAALAGTGTRSTQVLSVSVRVVGTARSRSLNARYRHKNKPTNVLSFAGAGPGADGRRYLGELVICAPVVAREARLQGKRRDAHWAHLTVHGVLHLLGFDHEDPAEARKMESREVQILDLLGFSDPYV